jgi:hypothetical protein
LSFKAIDWVRDVLVTDCTDALVEPTLFRSELRTAFQSESKALASGKAAAVAN